MPNGRSIFPSMALSMSREPGTASSKRRNCDYCVKKKVQLLSAFCLPRPNDLLGGTIASVRHLVPLRRQGCAH